MPRPQGYPSSVCHRSEDVQGFALSCAGYVQRADPDKQWPHPCPIDSPDSAASAGGRPTWGFAPRARLYTAMSASWTALHSLLTPHCDVFPLHFSPCGPSSLLAILLSALSAPAGRDVAWSGCTPRKPLPRPSRLVETCPIRRRGPKPAAATHSERVRHIT